MNTSETVVASIGLASLAVSLGAQGLVADVLAGLSIVFEGEFQVGDIVDIDGFEGTIQQIGVRTTKIRGREDDVFAASCVMDISRRRR